MVNLLQNHKNCITCKWNIFVGRGKKCMFNIKHKIIIIPVTKLKYGAQKQKKSCQRYLCRFYNYDNICVKGVNFLIALLLYIMQCN